jgi:hypothetical protein
LLKLGQILDPHITHGFENDPGITSKFYDDFTFNFAIPIEQIKKSLPAPK